jgi:hypothetical protein
MNIENNNQVSCYNCNKELELSASEKILRHEECPFCTVSLHACKMCYFFNSTAYNECREPMAERIVEKEKANFCSYFTLSGIKDENDKKDILSAANALFKN